MTSTYNVRVGDRVQFADGSGGNSVVLEADDEYVRIRYDTGEEDSWHADDLAPESETVSTEGRPPEWFGDRDPARSEGNDVIVTEPTSIGEIMMECRNKGWGVLLSWNPLEEEASIPFRARVIPPGEIGRRKHHRGDGETPLEALTRAMTAAEAS